MTYPSHVLISVYMQIEGRLLGPRGTHLADSLNAMYLAACSHSLLQKNNTEDLKRKDGHVLELTILE